MKDKNQLFYWEEYWNTNSIVNSKNKYAQVGRTKFGKPIEEDIWLKTCDFVRQRLHKRTGSKLLDLCCGNGLFEENFVGFFDKIVAVDYSSELLGSFLVENPKVTKLCQNVMDLDFQSKEFDSVLLYFSIQHLDETAFFSLASKVFNWLNEGGKFYIGDIPDIRKRWDFYSKIEYVRFFFESLDSKTPHIGFWYDQLFFEKLAEYIGFGDFEIIKQPDYQMNSHYRFDILLTK